MEYFIHIITLRIDVISTFLVGFDEGNGVEGGGRTNVKLLSTVPGYCGNRTGTLDLKGMYREFI